MTLKQTIRKVLLEEVEYTKEFFLKQYFEKKFENVSYVHEKDHNSRWYSKGGKELFIRNWWGVLWVSDCDFYNDLVDRAELFEYSIEEFYIFLVDFVNKKYSQERPLRDVGDESNCRDLDWS